MESPYKEMYTLLKSLHRQARETLEDLPPERLDQTHGPAFNSLGVLAAHIAGAERFWIGEIAGGEASGRVRQEEFETRGIGAAELNARLEAALAHSRGVLERLTRDDLAQDCPLPGDREPVSRAYALLHALEHTALHVGQMQITRARLDQMTRTDASPPPEAG